MNLKDQWSLDMALEILENSTVDSKLWAEAVEWLMLYGPDDVRKLLLQASSQATASLFPNLKAKAYTPDGFPIYDTGGIANELGIPKEEVERILTEKEQAHADADFFPPTMGMVQ